MHLRHLPIHLKRSAAKCEQHMQTAAVRYAAAATITLAARLRCAPLIFLGGASSSISSISHQPCTKRSPTKRLLQLQRFRAYPSCRSFPFPCSSTTTSLLSLGRCRTYSTWQQEQEHDDAPQAADTIFAPATPPGKSAICIIRISGPRVPEVYRSMVLPKKRVRHSTDLQAPSSASQEVSSWPPKARRAMLCSIYAPRSFQDEQNERTKIDEGLVLYFPSSSSLTGQDMLEFHLHGSTAVLKSTLSALGSIKGTRPAEPGEFTRLAFDAGKMDLTEVEGLRDLIESETEVQRRLAVRQAGGQMREAYDAMRKDIIGAMSVAEAMIDFGEDEGMDYLAFEPARQRILHLRDKIRSHLLRSQNAEIIRTGMKLAIFGAPNAGKSSFLNWLAKREASIVTRHPGTTRDVVELSLDLHGWPVRVSDTAGLRAETSDEVEQIGVQRAKVAVEEADLKLCIVSLPEALSKRQSSDGQETVLDELTSSLVDDKTLFLLNKVDALDPLTAEEDISQIKRRLLPPRTCSAAISSENDDQDALTARVQVASLANQTGLDAISHMLRDVIASRFDDFASFSSSEALLVTRERHRFHLQECLVCLDRAIELSLSEEDHHDHDEMLPLVDIAEELRYAAMSLGRVTGQIGVEEILDELFGSFCIGK